MRQSNFKFLTIAILAFVSFILTGCPGNNGNGGTSDNGGGTPENAATVNGKPIKMEDVERAVKQQGGGQEAKLSPLELAQARLQILDGLIQQEVMYQKAEKENTLPTDDEVTAEFNKAKQQSGLSADEFDKKMKEAGQTEQTAREQIKRGLAIQKLTDKITNKVEPAKDAEVEAFYNGNKEAFVKKRGVKLAAIVVDPANNGEGDTTTDAASAAAKIKEIATQLQGGADFASVAREKSEDQSRIQGGDLGYIAEDQLRQSFGEQIASAFMNPKFAVGSVTPPLNVQGKLYIFKLQERIDKDEAQTLESTGIRQSILDALLNNRKQLLGASYQALAMDEAKVENFLAKRIVDNPNELSGARPAETNTNSNANTNTAPANTNAAPNTNTAVNAKPAGNTKTAANTNAKPPVAPVVNTPANTKK